MGAITVVEDWAGLCALEAEWSELFAVCEGPSLCATHAWVAAWWRAFGQNADGAGIETALYVLVFRDLSGNLVGIAPFYEERPKSPVRVRRLRILGFIGHDGIFDMTEEPTLLAMPGWKEQILVGLAEALKPGLASGRWDAVYFRTHGDCPLLKKAFGRLRLSATVWTDVRSGSDYAELPPTWAEYRKTMTKSMRDNLGYYPRLLTRDGHDWHVRVLRSPGEMADATARLVELHRARAESGKGQRHDDHIHGPAQRRFLLGLLKGLAGQGRAYVAELVVDGRVVASQAFVESGEELMVYYSGYDEAWYRYSPIFVIDAHVFEDALERGVRRLDFLRNIAPWKTRWLARPGPKLHRAVLVSRRPCCQLRYGTYTLCQGFQRNVTVRLPILRQRCAAKAGQYLKTVGEARERLIRAAPSAFPAFEQIDRRVSPLVHAAAMHHRLVTQIAVHR